MIMGTLVSYNTQDPVCFQGLLFASCITRGKQLVAREHTFSSPFQVGQYLLLYKGIAIR